jgi:hypothetical protein
VNTPQVRLYIRIRRSDGRHTFEDLVSNRNRTLRVHYAVVQGRPEHHPEGRFYLRYLHNKKRIWQSVGSNGDVALVALLNTQHDLESASLGRIAAAPPFAPPAEDPRLATGRMLEEARQEYLAEVRQFRAPKTIAACENILTRFISRFPARCVEDISLAGPPRTHGRAQEGRFERQHDFQSHCPH